MIEGVEEVVSLIRAGLHDARVRGQGVKYCSPRTEEGGVYLLNLSLVSGKTFLIEISEVSGS